MDLTFEDLDQAVTNREGPAFDWLMRVHSVGGDALLRSLALDVVRNVTPVHADYPPELLEVFAAWLDDPDTHAEAMRRWLASDAFVWREFAKLAFEWGGTVRTGDELVEQTARVLYFTLSDLTPGPLLEDVRKRIPAVPS